MKTRKHLRGFVLITALLAVGLSPSARCMAESESNRGLLACWSFDEGKGDIVRDSSGSGNDAKVMGARWVKGILGSALEFDGRSDFVYIPQGLQDFDVKIGKQITIETWVKPEFTKGAKDEHKGGHNIIMKMGAWGLNATLEDTFLGYIWGYPDAVTSKTRLAKGKWYHVVFTFDGSTHKLYVDGKLEGSKVCEGTMKYSYTYENITIGIDGCSQYAWKGAIDEMRIYDRVLTDGEIEQHYLSVKSGKKIGDEKPTQKLPPLNTEKIMLPTTGNWLLVKGKHVVNSSGKEILLKGTNLHLSPKIFYTKSRLFNFNSVRLMLNWGKIEPEPGKYNEWELRRVDKAIEMASSENIYLILDIHVNDIWDGYPIGWFSFTDFWKNKNSVSRQRFYALWKMLAERYKDTPWVAGYDLINEPIWVYRGMFIEKSGHKADFVLEETNQDVINKIIVGAEKEMREAKNMRKGDLTWREISEECISEIRRVDKKHIIFWEPFRCVTEEFYIDQKPLEDKNVVYSFHHYFPIPVIHGQQKYSRNHYEAMAREIEKDADFGKKFNVPLWVGELAMEFLGSELVNKSTRWISDSIALFEKHDIGWSYYRFDDPHNGLMTGDYNGYVIDGPAVPAVLGLLGPVGPIGTKQKVETGKINVTKVKQDVNKGLAGYWSFDEGRGNTVKDISGNRNNGQIKGGAWIKAGKTGGAFKLDGKDDYIEIGNSTSLKTADSMTAALWVKIQSKTKKGEYRSLICKLSGGWEDPVAGYEITQHEASSVLLLLSGNGKSQQDGGLFAIASPELSLNEWHHVAVTFAGQDGKIYVDGEEVANGSMENLVLTTAKNLRIGHGYWGARVPFRGDIDEVRIYKRVLNADEIKYLYENSI